MSDTRSCLLKAVIAAPNDDLPRLVFADFLEESGEPERAYLIRWQIESGVSFWRDKGQSRWRNKAKRGVQFTNAMLWVGLNGFLSDFWPGPFTVSRGFVSAVECPLADWLAHGPWLVREHPVEKVEVTDKAPWHNDRGSNPSPGVPEELRLTDVWVWLRQHATDVTDDRYRLPLSIWNVLQRDAYATTAGFPTPDAATSALSAALLAWAAGQPA